MKHGKANINCFITEISLSWHQTDHINWSVAHLSYTVKYKWLFSTMTKIKVFFFFFFHKMTWQLTGSCEESTSGIRFHFIYCITTFFFQAEIFFFQIQEYTRNSYRPFESYYESLDTNSEEKKQTNVIFINALFVSF